MTIKVQSRKITPEQAAEWLASNTNNRIIKDGSVLRFVNDIQNGRWEQNAETIKFDTSGRQPD